MDRNQKCKTWTVKKNSSRSRKASEIGAERTKGGVVRNEAGETMWARPVAAPPPHRHSLGGWGRGGAGGPALPRLPLS